MFGFDLPATAYKIVAEVGVVLALLIAAFFYGNHVGTQKGDLAIANLTAKYEGQMTNLLGLQVVTGTKIVTQVVTKTVTIHDNQGKGDVAAHADVDDANITLSQKWTCIHNAAVNGADPTLCNDLVPVPGPNGTTIPCKPGQLCTKQ